MKRFFALGTVLLLGTLLVAGISPYLRIAEMEGGIDEAKESVISVLKVNGYEILGQYRPGNNQDLFVIVFTNDKLTSFCKKSKDRGMLAAAMKLGFMKNESKIVISLLNPEYLFYAYFRKLMEDASFKDDALSLSAAIKKDLKEIGTMDEEFGGDLTTDKLMNYKYMVGMPLFSKAVELGEFDSFEAGLSTIRKNLRAEKGGTVKVYELVDQQSKTAVFGVGLTDAEKGEAHFLPILGESHVAAMPYELILVSDKATMLHGRYRFALHWPELTKGNPKIMSSPGDVAEAMEALME